HALADRHLTAALHTDLFRHAHLHLLAHGAGHALGHRVGDLAVHRIRDLLADRARNLLADRIVLHVASGVGHHLLHRGRHHAADGHGHLLDAVLAHGVPDGVGHLLDTVLLDHVAGGVRVADLEVGAFLEMAARSFTLVTNAIAVHIGAAHAAGHRVRDLLLADFRLHVTDRVRDLLDAGLLDHAANRVRDLLDRRARDLLADRVRNLRVDALLHVGRAGNLLAHVVLFPDLAAADLVGLAALDLDPVLRAAALAGARIEAAVAAGLPLAVVLAGHA